MGGGGLMQLVAYGAQDIYLTGNPQITFFKVVYRRHTNFAMENIQQTFNGNTGFGSRTTVIVSRNGDLINSAYLYVKLPVLDNNAWYFINKDLNLPNTDLLGPGGENPFSSPSRRDEDDFELCWTNYIGLALINYVQIEIGGQEIDKQYGLWMYIWQELTLTAEKAEGYKRMVGGQDASGILLLGNARYQNELHVPLNFWFNINAGLSLPLIALQYHEVKFVFQFRPLNELVHLIRIRDGLHVPVEEWAMRLATVGQPNIELYIDYIYLDTDERRRFAQMSHEYLIEQIQHNESSVDLVKGGTISQRLTFNHPCKEIAWVFQRQDNIDNNDYFNFSNSIPGEEKLGGDILTNAVLRLNGHYRFNPPRGPLFFRQWQPFIHHTRIPDSNLYLYSFALRPEEHQPSGTCNFSRIDNTILEFSVDNRLEFPSPVVPNIIFKNGGSALMTVYARNYNVLRIMSGMGGMAYSN
jgi:hypothetical protein